MKSTWADRRVLDWVELVATAVTAGVGVSIAVGETYHRGFLDATILLLTGAAVAVAGLILVAHGQRRSRRAEVIVGLLLAVVSPTVFAYPLNVLLLAALAVELATAARRRLRVAS